MEKNETGGFNEGHFWMFTDNAPELVGTISPETKYTTADNDKIISSLAESIKDTVEREVKQCQSKQ